MAKSSISQNRLRRTSSLDRSLPTLSINQLGTSSLSAHYSQNEGLMSEAKRREMDYYSASGSEENTISPASSSKRLY